MAMTAGDVDAHVGRRIRLRRETIGMSQTRLGQCLGITFSQVQKYEKGSNRIGAGRLYLMAEHLGVPVHYFFEGLEAGTAEVNGFDRNNCAGEVALLDDAFQSIRDPGTRQSLLALVRSIALPELPIELPVRRAAG